ncbi:MAG: hypothetical protein HC903_04325 [Methylacidiphilales bacterium]|nr:hypothetical protein [Candidatus Methylacidiphilales bacterium]
MKTEKHPVNGQPDPARTLLTFFPELVDNNPNFDVDNWRDVEAIDENRTPDTISNNTSDDTINKLEALLKLEVSGVEIVEEIDETFLSRIVEIIAKSENPPVSFDAIRKHRSWQREWNTKSPASAALRQALIQLVLSERLVGNETEGYFLSNKN